MDHQSPRRAIAFQGARRLAEGSLPDVALRVKRATERGAKAPILLFDADTSERIDIDARGSDEEFLERLTPPPPRRAPGRPRLGVIAREVTLLPRHWDWLQDQPGGASVTLRRLVDEARRNSGGAERVRKARESAYRFLVAMAGDRPGFEEATRALFAGNHERFTQLAARWPAGIRAQACELMDRTRADA